MGRLDRRNDSLCTTQQNTCFHRILILYPNKLRSSNFMQMGMHRANSWIIQACRDGMWLNHLPILGLHQQGFGSMQNPRSTQYGCGSRLAGMDPMPRRLHSNQSHLGFIVVVVKCSSGIGSSTHTGNHEVRIFATFLCLQLPFDFFRDDGLKSCHHLWIRMRSHHRTDDVMRSHWIRNPSTHGFVGGIF